MGVEWRSGPGKMTPIDSASAAASPKSFYWYDLETSGTHPASDRIMQFAGCRTDAALAPVGEPFVTYIRLAPDVLPSPEACLVTGISPQCANARGMEEWQALNAINEQMRQPGTCVLGYNNLRFDDDFLRHGFYRNLLDPYAREWQDGNSRWDLIDLVRAACALRPEGLRWPRDDGVVTFKLERLSAENGVAHGDPHDAMADVKATLGLARLLKAAQPRLWRFALGHRSREAVQSLLFPLGKKLCLHVSPQFANERRCAAPVTALAVHPDIGNRVIVVDLAQDISALIECDAVELNERLFAPRDANADPEAADERPPLKEIALNRCPFLAPINVVRPADAVRLKFDLEEVERRRRQLAAVPDLAEKVAAAYRRDAPRGPADDAELALYDGFVDDADKRAMARLQSALAATTDGPWPTFQPADERLRVLGERLKARLQSEQLDADERKRWQDHVRRCLRDGFGRRPSLETFKVDVAQLRSAETDPQRLRLLTELAAYGTAIEQAPFDQPAK